MRSVIQSVGRNHSRSLLIVLQVLAMVACGEQGAGTSVQFATSGGRSAKGRRTVAGTGGAGGQGEVAVANLAGVGGLAAVGGSGSVAKPMPGPCMPLQSPEMMPARSAVTTPDLRPSMRRVFTADLYSLFFSNCGACHVEQSQGNFGISSEDDFPKLASDAALQRKILDSLQTDDQALVMPPYGLSGQLVWSDRLTRQSDPIVELNNLLQGWFDSGANPYYFDLPAEPLMSMSPYMLSDETASSLTNIGTCLPDKLGVGTDQAQMDKLDALFANSTALPLSLDQTDLTSFDSEELARTGVISFAPAYPLFSDNAHKTRHVRVPRGDSIRFDKQAQEFSIPPNTRFYKTFFKRMIEADGTERYRKIETRLILSRPDGDDQGDGSHQTRALFGTYAWDDNEQKAELVTDPLRDGSPFRDRSLTYVIDEAKAAAAFDGPALNKLVALRDAHSVRTYAIPGAPRCLQCHSGSSNHSFVLGFTPLQIQRRRTGEGGTYEETGPDELTQLQRLIDYGVVSGVASLADVLPLERSQGERLPRNDNELKAQGYMLGNCANCHNPRGYPTVQNPVLKDLLNFLPDGKAGGVFQFPLSRVSPRIHRGLQQDVDIPYITPSLIDMEDKWPTAGEYGSNPGSFYTLPILNPYSLESKPDTTYYIAAPWRSLIWRNVDSPFMYAADYALYPHMPMNAPGYDPRAGRIMADWMISIPARLRADVSAKAAGPQDLERNTTGQPYEEVGRDDAGYKAAVDEAKARLGYYHNGGRAPYDFLKLRSADERNNGMVSDELAGIPDTHAFTYFSNARYASTYSADTSDIVDYHLDPAHDRFTPADESGSPARSADVRRQCDAAQDLTLECASLLHHDSVPDRPHWVVTDTTDSPPPWYPRRADWASVLAPNNATPAPAGVGSGASVCTCAACLDNDDSTPCSSDCTRSCEQQRIVDLLRSDTTKLTDAFRRYALTAVPFATWKQKPECDFKGIPSVALFPENARPSWMRSVPSDAPIFQLSPGATVFGEICVNCHGPNYDSRGRQADNLAQITGGTTRVANFRAGMFGPMDDPGANWRRDDTFGQYATAAVTVDDWAARYMAWMALGGTKSRIDRVILGLVAGTPVYGTPRMYPIPIYDANMLSIARTLCNQTKGIKVLGSPPFSLAAGAVLLGKLGVTTSFADGNGDLDLWKTLCEFQNPRPIYVTAALPETEPSPPELSYAFYKRGTYPKNTPIGDGADVRSELSDEVRVPWCVPAPKTDAQKAVGKQLEQMRQGKPLPYCPTGWDSRENQNSLVDDESWEVRGAINAGMAVFLYLDQRAREAAEGKMPQPDFDHCENLAPQEK